MASGSIRLNAVAPNFSGDSTFGPFNLYDFMDKKPDYWLLFFSHPADFSNIL
jgi:alkyl hydroperoxide reductase subunit AhpC